MLGDQLLIFEHLLLCTDQLGSHIPKPDCDYQWFSIEDDGDGQIVVIDDQRGNFWRQPRKDGLAFELNWWLIYRMLCKDIGIEFGYRKVDGFRFIHRVGTDRPAAGVELPVYHHRGEANVETAKLLMATEGPLVVLYAGCEPIDEPLAAMLRHRGCLSLPLLQNVVVNDRGVTVLLESAKDRIDAYRCQHASSDRISETEAVFVVSNDANWPQVHIKFIDQHTIRVSVDSKSRAFHYSQLAMANSRNATPTKQWTVLKSYAEAGGFIDWKSRGSSANLKKQTQELNKKLKAALGIAGAPIEYDNESGGYRTAFTIEDM
ncbi:MAG: hypothetical protein WBD31_03765 [Rubripirellula sp.]